MPVKLDMSGLEKFKKKVQELSGTHRIPLSELLPDNFIAQHTEFPTLQALVDAVRKIDDGSFGICTECSEPIAKKRLEARPETQLCIKCKEDQERDEKAYG